MPRGGWAAPKRTEENLALRGGGDGQKSCGREKQGGMKVLKSPREGLGIAKATKGESPWIRGWDTPAVALLCPTLLPGPPGGSPSHSSTGATLCSPQHCRVTVTLQHWCPAACTGWVCPGCMENRRAACPGQQPVMACPAAHQCCCGAVCEPKGCLTSAHCHQHHKLLPESHKDGAAQGWEETLV